MKRRDFPLIGAGTAAAAGAAIWVARRSGVGPAAHQYGRYERAIRKYLSTLEIDTSVIVAFAEAWEQHNGTFEGDDERLATKFLLSTDFFSNGEDESQPLSFVRLFDPYVVPCGNPLTHLPT